MQKYRILSDRYHFKPLGFETFGSLGHSAVEIIGQIGRRIGEETGEPRSLSCLRQRISLEIQRGNATSVLGTFKFNKDLSAVYTFPVSPVFQFSSSKNWKGGVFQFSCSHFSSFPVFQFQFCDVTFPVFAAGVRTGKRAPVFQFSQIESFLFPSRKTYRDSTSPSL